MEFDHFKALGFWVTRISSSMRALIDKEAESLGLTSTDAIIIMFLNFAGPHSLVELSRKMAFAHPSVLRKIDTLEKKGILEREPHPEDRRIKLISLTAKGKTLGPLVHNIMLKVNRQARGGFREDEYEHLINILVKVYKNVADDDDPIMEIIEKHREYCENPECDLIKHKEVKN